MAPRLPSVTGELAQALELALKYWADRQQRYKNRHPVWVQAAHDAIAAYRAAPTAPAPDADGWIAHDGGPCPVAPETEVFVKCRDGYVTSIPTEACFWDEEKPVVSNWQWAHPTSTSIGYDIVAYRPVQS